MQSGPLNFIGREFSPAEFAKITGISTSLQRDWRRRKILPERYGDGWSQFSHIALVEGAILGLLATAGFSPKQMTAVTDSAWAQLLALILKSKGALEYGGVADDEKEIRYAEDRGPPRIAEPFRYLVLDNSALKHSQEFTDSYAAIFPCADFAAVQAVSEKIDHPICTIIDLQRLADQCVQRGALPLMRVEVVNCSENAGFIEFLKQNPDATVDLSGLA